MHFETEVLGAEALAAVPSRDFMGVMWLDDPTALRMPGLPEGWRELRGQPSAKSEHRARADGTQPYPVQMMLLAPAPHEPVQLTGPPG